MKKLKVYWWKTRNGDINFGDELGARLLEELGYEVEWAPMSEADIITTGTILQRANEWGLRPGSYVWGTGWADLPIENHYRVLAVRGQKTADHLGVDVPLGDPGLLASHFWPAREKKYRIGVVKHYTDQNSYPWADTTISVNEDPKEVCLKISECELIASSSLHGLIVARSYGIPFMRLNGSGWRESKYIDFLTTLSTPVEVLQSGLLEAISVLEKPVKKQSKVKAVSFYTDQEDSDGFYAKAAKSLEAEAEWLGQELEVEELAGEFEYLEATRAKPGYILRKLEETGGPVVWIDADCHLHKAIDFRSRSILFPLTSDGEKPSDHVHYWPNTTVAKKVLKAWAEKCKDWPGGDHTALVAVLEELAPAWKPFPTGYVSNGRSATPSKKRGKAGLPQGWGVAI